MAPPSNFSTALRAWREHHSLSQYELAKLAGVSRGYIAGIERNRAPPSRTMVLVLELHLPACMPAGLSTLARLDVQRRAAARWDCS